LVPEASIRDAIRAGRLPRGASLPPTRRLAADLGVSRGVVVEAYQQLAAEGYLTSRAGSFTRVAIGPEVAVRPAQPLPSRAPQVDPPGAPGRHGPAVRLRQRPRIPALHRALAEYLNRVRGTSARPDDIVICNGYARSMPTPWFSRPPTSGRPGRCCRRARARRCCAGRGGARR
jgi:GntR family transcriptional regulator/MocR family aminotransferase